MAYITDCNFSTATVRHAHIRARGSSLRTFIDRDLRPIALK